MRSEPSDGAVNESISLVVQVGFSRYMRYSLLLFIVETNDDTYRLLRRAKPAVASVHKRIFLHCSQAPLVPSYQVLPQSLLNVNMNI